MSKVKELKKFDYSNDRLVIADISTRDKSYVVILEKKINEIIESLNKEIDLRVNRDKQFEKRVEIAEKKAADVIKAAGGKEGNNE